MPDGFSLVSGDSLVCQTDGNNDNTYTSASCSLSSDMVTLTTTEIMVSSGCKFSLDTSGSGISYRGFPSSDTSPIEWNLKLTHTDDSV